MEKLLEILDGKIPSCKDLKKLGLSPSEYDIITIAKAYCIDTMRKRQIKPGKVNKVRLIERTLENMRKEGNGSRYGAVFPRGDGEAFFTSPTFLLNAPMKYFDGVNPYYFGEPQEGEFLSNTERFLNFTSEKRETIQRQEVSVFQKVFKKTPYFPVGDKYFRCDQMMNVFKFLDATEITVEIGRFMLKAVKDGVTIVVAEIRPKEEVKREIHEKWRKNDGNE